MQLNHRIAKVSQTEMMVRETHAYYKGPWRTLSLGLQGSKEGLSVNQHDACRCDTLDANLCGIECLILRVFSDICCQTLYIVLSFLVRGQ